MAPHEAGDITQLLAAVQAGSTLAVSELTKRVYQQLHRMARRRLQSERPDHTLQPTALVNEAYVLLIAEGDKNWQNRAHFFAVAANVMRRILIDYARAERAKKRGGGKRHAQPLNPEIAAPAINIDEVLSIDEALNRLEQIDPRASRIVELRYYAGMTEEEVAEILGISVRTIKRDWNMARSFLRDEMSKTPPR